MFSGQVAMVTGASRGIGAAIATALGEAGAAVAVNYRERNDSQSGADSVQPVDRSAEDPVQRQRYERLQRCRYPIIQFFSVINAVRPGGEITFMFSFSSTSTSILVNLSL